MHFLTEQLVLNNKDASFTRDYTEAIDKIKAVLKHSMKDKANLLSERTRYDQNLNRARTSNNLSQLQLALTNFRVASPIQYGMIIGAYHLIGITIASIILVVMK